METIEVQTQGKGPINPKRYNRRNDDIRRGREEEDCWRSVFGFD
jgi:hypothetical protein